MELKELIEKKKLAERQINDILNNLQKETKTTVTVDVQMVRRFEGSYFSTTINLTL